MADMRWSPEDWARLGGKIRESREAQGYSRKRLAAMSGVSEKSIQLTEEGRVPTRWPKSLDALAEALNWAPGGMRNVLAGGDVEYNPTLFDNSSLAAGGAPTVEWFDMERHGRSDDEGEEGAATGSPGDLPPEIQEALPAVMFFGSNCVAHGAPEWLGAAYDNAVAALLKHLSEPPPKYEALPDKPAQPRTSPSPTPSGRRSPYPGAFLGAQDQVLWKMQKQHREALRKLAEAATYSQRTAEITAMGQMKGLRETVERANKDLAAIGKFPAAQTQALRDLSQQLQALTAFTKFQQQLLNPALQVGLGGNEDAEDSGTSDRPEGEDEG